MHDKGHCGGQKVMKIGARETEIANVYLAVIARNDV
jgi:hypothetical protein